MLADLVSKPAHAGKHRKPDIAVGLATSAGFLTSEFCPVAMALATSPTEKCRQFAIKGIGPKM